VLLYLDAWRLCNMCKSSNVVLTGFFLSANVVESCGRMNFPDAESLADLMRLQRLHRSIMAIFGAYFRNVNMWIQPPAHVMALADS
jgi:hypothetical protein